MTRGRKPIHTRQQIADYLLKNMTTKGMTPDEAEKRKNWFVYNMGFNKDLRPPTKSQAEALLVDRNYLSKLIERYEQDLR